MFFNSVDWSITKPNDQREISKMLSRDIIADVNIDIIKKRIKERTRDDRIKLYALRSFTIFINILLLGG
jgi:hypothetical protein